jgi:hypothetical protein
LVEERESAIGVGEPDERGGCVAGWADVREDEIDRAIVVEVCGEETDRILQDGGGIRYARDFG